MRPRSPPTASAAASSTRARRAYAAFGCCTRRAIPDMTPSVAQPVCDAGATIGESPLWLRGQVLWTDPVRRHLLSLVDGGLRVMPTAEPVGSLAALLGADIF